MTVQDPLIHPANLYTRVIEFLLPPPFFFLMFRDLIPRTIDGWAPLPFLRRWVGRCCCCYWWRWQFGRWRLQRQRRGWVPSSDGVLMLLGLGEAWTLVEVWMEVLMFWTAWVMKGWIERVLVGGSTSSVGPAASWTPSAAQISPGLDWKTWPREGWTVWEEFWAGIFCCLGGTWKVEHMI